MYFADAYPGLTEDQRRSFAQAERRLVRRLVAMSSLGFLILAITLI